MDIETRLRRLEDIEAVKQLKYRYCAACDADYDCDRLAALFTKDAVWEGGEFGVYTGREAIREFFAGAPKLIAFAVHYVTNPIVEIDGDRATGEWFLWEPIVFSQGKRAMWLAATYHDHYRREKGQWLFERVALKLRMLTPYEKGFAKARLATPPGKSDAPKKGAGRSARSAGSRRSRPAARRYSHTRRGPKHS